jgi:hypothetical protein
MIESAAIRSPRPAVTSAIAYEDPFVTRLVEDVHGLITGDVGLQPSVTERLLELTAVNSPAVAAYWQRTSHGAGVPDTAFKRHAPYLFPRQEPARTFLTSGTTARERGRADYSRHGLELMNASILANAGRHMLNGLDRPAFIRFVPPPDAAPTMIMAYGMDLIERTFGDPGLSGSALGQRGVDYDRLRAMLDRAVEAGRPVVMIGASFAFVNICDQLEAQGRRWQLPAGSRMIDAGGFKTHSRVIGTEDLRSLVFRSFGIAPADCKNLFGMTELASQLYDGADRPVGPRGERPKCSETFVKACVRDPLTLEMKPDGRGLLEVFDLCVLDRPPVVLTGDIGVASPDGVAIVGRVERAPRGCSLVLDQLTAGGADARG